MITQFTPCDPQRLQRLLDGTLSDAAQTEVERHVEACETCRRRLETLAADDAWWQGTREAFQGLERDAPTYCNEPGRTTAANELTDARSIPLTFLAPSDNPAMIGRLGEFEILEPIGCGGMGIVLKGYDHQLNRYVAVKVLHPHCATSAAARRRFGREAQAAAAVVHQHVIAIHAVDANHYPPYLVMPFVPGESLQQRLDRQGPLEVVDVLRVGQQIAAGLAAAHAQGLVHRDIKPANILLERNVERVLITDFGLARAADDASLTRSGFIAGTPQFMSPEQARGEAVDPRTDLFSLGTLLYALFAGHSPFRAETSLGVLRRVCEETPRPLREINSAVPEWLEALIAKLQAKRPDERLASAAHVSELLKGCLAHVQHPTRFPLPPEVNAWIRRRQLVTRRNALIAVCGACVFTAVAALALDHGLFVGHEPSPRHIVQPVPRGNSTSSDVSSSLPATTETSADTRKPKLVPIFEPWLSWDDTHEHEAAVIRRELSRLEAADDDPP